MTNYKSTSIGDGWSIGHGCKMNKIDNETKYQTSNLLLFRMF